MIVLTAILGILFSHLVHLMKGLLVDGIWGSQKGVSEKKNKIQNYNHVESVALILIVFDIFNESYKQPGVFS